MKKLVLLISVLIFSFAKAQAQAQANPGQCTGDSKKCGGTHGVEEKDDHDHEEESGQPHSEKETGDHEKEGKGHGHKNEEGEHEESTQVGPDKGVLEANEEAGFKLSPEATKNFKLKFQTYNGGQISLSLDSILQTTEEKNIYRVRNGFIKRIDISVVLKTKTELTFTSSALQAGDQIVVSGLGFLRMAELAAFGGAPEGHSH